MTKGSWARLGIQQTPLLDYEEGIYRYRFQGTTFTERDGFYTSADAGASFHYNFPIELRRRPRRRLQRRELQQGRAERPEGVRDPRHGPAVRDAARRCCAGCGCTGFYDGDNYVKDAARTRAVGQVTFEHQYLNAGFDYIDAQRPDVGRPSRTSKPRAGRSGRRREADANGSSWRCCCATTTWRPNESAVDQTRQRTIVGVAYWFPHQGSVHDARCCSTTTARRSTTSLRRSPRRKRSRCTR